MKEGILMAETNKKSVFETLASIDVTGDTVVKGEGKYQTNYVPWARAIEKLKMHYPDAIIEECTFKTQKCISVLLSETPEGKTYENIIVGDELPYGTDGRTCWVKTCVKIPSQGIEEYCTLPIMDNRNASIKAENVTSTDVNKALRRCVAKNIAYLGYGLSMWLKDDYTDLAKDQKILDKLDRSNAIDKFKGLIKQGFDKQKLVAWSTDHFGTANPQSIKSDEVLNRLSEELDKLDIKDFQPDKKAKKE